MLIKNYSQSYLKDYSQSYLKDYKQIHDNIHGYIKISNIACAIIDTVEFQRLRYLHQLGTCYFVYPTATHTRFEHSIGVYHLTGRMLDNIKNNSNMEEINKYMVTIKELTNYYEKTNNDCKLDDYICELVKIAGLCHDLGHGPFSHMFDDVFIPSIKLAIKATNDNNKLEQHEYRSCKILKHIIKNSNYLNSIITTDDLKFIKTLINPSQQHTSFIYQIVSNNFNSIDVDKYDYLERDTKNLGLKFGFDSSRLINDVHVIDNKICFPEQMYHEVASIFTTRYRLHKQVYIHKMVLATQYMMYDIMNLLDPIVHIYDSIYNINDFCSITDDFIISSVKMLYKMRHQYTKEQQLSIEEAFHIWNKLCTRDLYRFVKSIVSEIPIDTQLYSVINDANIDMNSIVVHKSKIGFVSGKKSNPFNNMYFYNNKDVNCSFKIEPEKVTCLMPTMFQEYVYTVFVKDRSNVELEERLINLFNEFTT